MKTRRKRRICFVTGTRAEFGLMASALRKIAGHPLLSLQIIATGMHLDERHGASLERIGTEGWRIDAIVPWASDATPAETARATGLAMSKLADEFERLDSQIVLVVGDRVEAFAAASAAHLSGRVVAHVHGGDRALGQVDDTLRHAISKLAHLHFPATRQSAQRLARLGEDRWRICRVGAPGLDGIGKLAAPWSIIQSHFPKLSRRQFALLVLHPTTDDDRAQTRRARRILKTLLKYGWPQVVIVHPNNDPGSRGIANVWDNLPHSPGKIFIHRDLPRELFLGLMKETAVLIGNSSSGIIEAASFGTHVIDIGPRQKGRECGGNVRHVADNAGDLAAAIVSVARLTTKWRGTNLYAHNGEAGIRVANVLASAQLNERLRRKLIAY